MNELAARVSRYFLDLGFYPAQIEFGTGLPLRRVMWTISAYVLLFLGLFSHQCIDLGRKPIEFSTSNVRLSVLAASAVLAIALFPAFIHWFNHKRKQPSWEHILWAFSFGFFIDLSSTLIWKRFF